MSRPPAECTAVEHLPDAPAVPPGPSSPSPQDDGPGTRIPAAGSNAGGEPRPAAGCKTPDDSPDVEAADGPETLEATGGGTAHRTGPGTRPAQREGRPEREKETPGPDAGGRDGRDGIGGADAREAQRDAWKAAIGARNARQARNRPRAKAQAPRPGMVRYRPPGGAA